MTQPQQGQNTETNPGSNPPNPAAPHASPPGSQAPPPPRAVVVNNADPGLTEQVGQMAQTLRALPETLVNAFREAVSSNPPPAGQPPAGQQPPVTTSQVQAPATETHQQNVQKSGYKGPGRVASWFFGLGERK